MDTNLKKATKSFEELVKIVQELRKKCPWDSNQTLESIRTLTIEETFELSAAILNKDIIGIKEEIGDLLLHILLYAQIMDEKYSHNIYDILFQLSEKLIQRHPHIYKNGIAKNEVEVKKKWEKIKKKQEKKKILAGIPESLPTLIQTFRIQEKLLLNGIVFEQKKNLIEDIKNTLILLEKKIIQKANKEDTEKILGKIFFSLVHYALQHNINPDNALSKENKIYKEKYKDR